MIKQRPRRKFPKKIVIMLGVVVLLLAAGIMAVAFITNNRPSKVVSELANVVSKANPLGSSAAEKAGRDLSGGKCSGSGSVQLTVSPMKPEDVAFIIPYGLMVDGHVTPIDHQYFSPTVFNSPPDTYEVRAMADGKITEISHRGQVVGGGGKPSNDYRFVFSHTCTFLTYYDLVTSLAPDIKAEFDKAAKNTGSSSFAQLDIAVKAGQLVGRIGGQTLDFAVWDTTKPLSGFVTPKLYDGERWKLYTGDPLNYYSPELKATLLNEYLRNDEGKSGRIDWDVDGKLIGNWFQEGTNGYEGDRGKGDGRYWRGHLAIAPDHLDPNYYIASFGTFAIPGDGEQFVIKTANPNPAAAGTSTGLIKYDLAQWSYMSATGTPWDRKTITVNPKIAPSSRVLGCALFQMLEDRKLKAEPFPNRSCGTVSGFTVNAKIFTR